MGFVQVRATIKSFGPRRRTYEADFLADTGAMDSLVPAAELRNIGVKPVGTEDYQLADGSVRQFRFGLAEISVMGRTTAGRVLFGDDDASPILGVTALESAGFGVDPVNQILVRVQPRL
jgi:clan AA aspartic protease